MAKQDYQQAIAAYRQVIESAPQNAQAHYQLAMAFKQGDRKKDAIAALEKARDLYRSQGKTEGVQQTEAALQEMKKSS